MTKKSLKLKNPMILIAGSTHRDLASRLTQRLSIPFIQAQTHHFADQELSVQIEGSVWKQEVLLLQSTYKPVNDHLMELLLLADAAKCRGAKGITAVVPYFGYGRQDRPFYTDGPIAASLVANLLKTAGIDRLITIDLHASQPERLFTFPLQNLSPISLFVPLIEITGSTMVVSPDKGSIARAQALSASLNLKLAIINKQRMQNGSCIMSHISGNVHGQDCLIIDDIIDTGGTLLKACEFLKEQGARSVKAYVTHGVFSSSCLKNIEDSPLETLFTTDTIPQSIPSKKHQILSIEPLLFDALKKLSL